jgi:hypothetical protein
MFDPGGDRSLDAEAPLESNEVAAHRPCGARRRAAAKRGDHLAVIVGGARGVTAVIPVLEPRNGEVAQDAAEEVVQWRVASRRCQAEVEADVELDEVRRSLVEGDQIDQPFEIIEVFLRRRLRCQARAGRLDRAAGQQQLADVGVSVIFLIAQQRPWDGYGLDERTSFVTTANFEKSTSPQLIEGLTDHRSADSEAGREVVIAG